MSENWFYTVNTWAWTRIAEADTGEEVTNSMCIVEEWTVHGWQIWKNTNSDPLVLWTDDVNFAQLNISVPTEDKFVKISATDSTEKYLDDAIANPTTTTWQPAYVNNSNIQVYIENAWSNELLRFGIDLSAYTWDISITGWLTVSWDTELHNLSFSTGSTVNRDNTTQTWSTTYDSGYTATYDDSTINYTNWTDVNQDATSIYNNSWTTNNGLTSTINNSGETNYDSNSTINNNGWTVNNTNTTENNVWVTENYDNTSTTNNNGNTINNNNTTENYNSTYAATSSTWPSNLPMDVPIDTNATKANVTLLYDNTANVAWDTWTKTITITEQSWLVLVEDSSNWHTGKIIVEWNTTSGNIELRQTDWAGSSTGQVDQFSGGVIINDNWSITNNENTVVNNDNTTTNNTSVNEYYDSNSTVVNEWDVYNENLTVNNITLNNWWSVVVNWSWVRQNENTVWATEIVLTDTPLWWEAWLLVFKQDSWLHRTSTTDYTYDDINNKITFYALISWEEIEVRYMKANISQIDTGVWFKEICETTTAWWPWLIHTISDSEVTANTKVLVFVDDSTPPTWFITAKSVAWWVEIYSTQAEWVLNICVLVFTATPSAIGVQMKKWADTFASGSNTYVVTDWDITEDSMIDVYPKIAPVGNWTVLAEAWQFTITSTATETANVDFNWKAVL